MAMLGHLGRFPVFLVSCGFVYPYKFTCWRALKIDQKTVVVRVEN